MFAASLPDFFLDALVSGGITTLSPCTDFFTPEGTIHDMIKWKPHSASRSNWVTKTGLSFDPFECAAVLSDQRLLCPKCKAAVNVREYSAPYASLESYSNTLIAYVTSGETGYAQQKFSHTCQSCTFEITKGTLAVAKLTTDLTAHLLHESQTGATNMHLFLP